MNLREHIGSLHANLHDLRSLADRIDAEVTTGAQRSGNYHAPIRWPGAPLNGLSVVLHDGPSLCGAREPWHVRWREEVLASKEPVALALLVEYDKRYAALQLGCELELDVSAVKLSAQNGEASPTMVDHDPPYSPPKKIR